MVLIPVAAGPNVHVVVSGLHLTRTYTVSGKLDATGGATGALRAAHASFDQAGSHFGCAGSVTQWTARRA